LPETARDSYLREGYVSPVTILSAGEAAAKAAIVDDLAASCGAPAIRLPFTHAFFRWSFELAAHPAMLDLVESLIGPDIVCWGTLILSKPAGSRGIVSWHQDSAYTRFLDGVPALSSWIALTPATRESGCMRVIPRSNGERLPFTAEKPQDDILIRGLRITAPIDESAAVDLELQPGEASLHELSLIHGSDANRSAHPRTGFIARYAAPAMRQPAYPVYCVRGNPGTLRCAAPPEAPPDLAGYLAYYRSETN
jgi:ectoine hydroxylase-related dioxygenase (phytanoyl-CoA dioxygenase family)